MEEAAKAAAEDKPKGGEETVESIAIELGWNPEYEGEGAKTAAEFIRESRKIIKTQGRERKRLEKAIEDMKDKVVALDMDREREHNASVQRYQMRIKKLESERQEAVKDGDKEAVKQIDDEIRVEKRAAPQKALSKYQSNPEQYNLFISENRWLDPNSNDYNPEAAETMNNFVAEMMIHRPEYAGEGNEFGFTGYLKAPQKRVLEASLKKTQSLFPEIKPEPQTAPSVETVGRRPKPSTKSEGKLPPEAVASMNRAVKNGIMTKEEWIENYRKQA